MSLEYSRSALRIVVAQICQNLGWNSINSTPLELLTDVLERYLLQVAKLSHRYSEQFGLTDPRLEDVGLALAHMGVSLAELEDYVKHVDPIVFPKEVIAFPAPKANDLKFPNPESREIQQRKVFEFVPEHLPYMHPELNEDTEDSNPPPVPSPDRLQVEQQPQTAEQSPVQGEKRPISSPGDSNLPFKRPRLTTSHLPDEASHSQYEMTSVVMTNSGILSPLRQGKIPDARTPPVAKQIIIVKSASTGAPKGPGVTPAPGIPLNTETPVIKLDFSKDPVNGQSKIVEVDAAVESGTKIDQSDPEYVPKKKKNRDKIKLGQQIKIKRGPGRPKSPGSAPPVVHKQSDLDIIKMLTLPRKDDSLGKLDVMNQQGPIDLSVKPTPAPPNISVRLDESLRAKPVEYKQKVTTLSKEQEKDMEDTIASVIQKSCQESELSDDNEPNAPQSVIYREGSLPSKNAKKDPDSGKNEDVWRVTSISETFTDDNAHDPYDIDGDRNERLLSPPQQYIAPHLKLLQESPRRRGRPRGSSSSIFRGLTSRGRKPGRPPLNRSPGRPPISRSPGRPPLNRSPGRPPGTGRSPGRPKGSLNKNHSPKPRGRPRGSKSPRSRGSSPRGMSPRGAIQNINFDVNTMTESITKPYDKEDSNDSEATNFEFPTHSSESDTDKKSVELELDKDRKNFELSDEDTPFLKKITPAPSPVPSPVPSPKRSSREGSPDPTPETFNKDLSPIKSADVKRDSSLDLSDREVKEKLQDSEEDSRKTTNYGELDNQSRHSNERESSAESVYKKETSLEREKRLSSGESPSKDLASDKEQRKESEEREVFENRHFSKERSYSREKERSYSKEIERSYSQDRERSSSKEKARSYSKEKEIKQEIFEPEERETSIERDYKERMKLMENKENSVERMSQKDSSLERDYREFSKERESKERSKEREHKEHSKEREIKERSKEREHKEHSKDREHKERSKEREHKEHRKDKEHKKDKKKKKKKDKDKDRERDKDEKREKKEKHKSKEKESREESPSVQPLVQKLKIKFGGASASSPGSFSISASTTPSSPARESLSPVHRPEIPKLKFKVLPPKPDSGGLDKDKPSDPQSQSWTSSVKQEAERVPTPKHDPVRVPTPKLDPSPKRSPPKVKSEPAEDSDHDGVKTQGDSDKDMNNSADGETEVTVSVIRGKITGIGGAKKPGKRGKRKGSAKKGKPKIPKLTSTPAVSATPESKVLPVKKALNKASSESPSHLFSMDNVPSPITIPALKAAPPPPSPPASKKSPPKPKPLLKERDVKPPSPLVKEVTSKTKPPPVNSTKAAKITKTSPRRSSPRKSPKISPPIKKKGSVLSTPSSKSPSPKPPSPTKSTPFDFTAPRTPSPTPHSTPSHSAPSSPMYSPASSPSRDSLSFQIPPTPAFRPRTTSPPLSPPSRQISTDDEKEDTPPAEKPRMPPPTLPPMPPTSAMRRQQRSVVVETIGSFVNESGEKIWICPTCTMQDDGSPMVGCDICDDWYHWACVGIKEEPTEEAWYCPKCKPTKTQQKKRGRKKKK